MSDILLIQPPIRDFYLTAKRTIPYGLASIAAMLEADGFTVTILDALATRKARICDWPENMDYLQPYYGRFDRSPLALFHTYRHYGYTYEHIGQHARASDAWLVGISALFTPYFDEALKAAEVVKQFHPQCKIVMGGHHPTAFGEDVLQHPVVDYIIRGEGEQALPKLAHTLKAGNANLEQIPGIGFRRTDGSIHLNPPSQVRSLDQLALPSSNLLNQKYYARNNAGSAVVVTSRGCPLNCSYCCMGASSPLRYRRRSIDSVMHEIEAAVVNHAAGFIDFEDEALAWDREWFRNLLNAIDDRFRGKGPELRAMNGLYPLSLDKAVVHSMRTAGFKAINLSLGTTSLAQLKRFNRQDVRKAFELALEWAALYGMDTVGYVIAAAPFQEAETTLEDLLYLAQRNVLIGVSVFYPAPGSRDYRLCVAKGLLPESYAQMRASALPLDHTTTRTEAVTLLRLARIINFMKKLVGQGERLPQPRKATSKLPQQLDSNLLGRELISNFLYDGKIRGVDATGSVYEHLTAMHLTMAFLNRFDIKALAPVRT